MKSWVSSPVNLMPASWSGIFIWTAPPNRRMSASITTWMRSITPFRKNGRSPFSITNTPRRKKRYSSITATAISSARMPLSGAGIVITQWAGRKSTGSWHSSEWIEWWLWNHPIRQLFVSRTSTRLSMCGKYSECTRTICVRWNCCAITRSCAA